MGAKGWTLSVLVLLTAAISALFYIQNSLRLTDLSLDLYFFAFELRDPIPVPAALLASFGLGLVLGPLLLAVTRSRRAVEPTAQTRTSSAGGDLWT